MQQSHLLPMVFHWSKASFVRIHRLKVFGCHNTSYGSWGASIHKKWRVVHPVMLLSTKLGHHQQYYCKVHCFQQYGAICQHLTTQGKKSTVSLQIKLTQKTVTTPVSIKWLCWTFMCGFLKGKAFKSNYTVTWKQTLQTQQLQFLLAWWLKNSKQGALYPHVTAGKKKPFQSLL